MKISIGIFTAPGPKYEARRQLARDTWLKSIGTYPNLEYYWVYGGQSEARLDWRVDETSRELWMPCQEGYNFLPQKTRRWFQWVLGNKTGWTYAMKCDDDTYVDLHRLANANFTGDYIGQEYNGYASGGGGYLLSPRAAEIARDRMLQRTGDEDLIAGQHMKRNGIMLTNDSRFCGFSVISQRYPRLSNDMITGHGSPSMPDEMVKGIHADLCDTTGMRLWMPIGDGLYRRAGEICCSLLSKYWPDHPPLDVTHFGDRPSIPNASRLFGLGSNKPWRAAALEYLNQWNADPFVLVILDDYAICRDIDRRAIAVALDYMRTHPDAASYALTWNPTATTPSDSPGTVKLARYDYQLNLQACIWRRSTLVDLLTACKSDSIWQLETEMTRLFNEKMPTMHAAQWDITRPANASGMVDSTDKSGWIVPYNNICHQRKFDPRWNQWLMSQGHRV